MVATKRLFLMKGTCPMCEVIILHENDIFLTFVEVYEGY